MRAPKKEEPVEISSELALAIHKFAELSHEIMTSSVKENKKEVPLGVCTEALNFLKDQEAIFVTPGDLFQHCSDLQQVGTIEVEYAKGVKVTSPSDVFKKSQHVNTGSDQVKKKSCHLCPLTEYFLP